MKKEIGAPAHHSLNVFTIVRFLIGQGFKKMKLGIGKDLGYRIRPAGMSTAHIKDRPGPEASVFERAKKLLFIVIKVFLRCAVVHSSSVGWYLSEPCNFGKRGYTSAPSSMQAVRNLSARPLSS